MIIKQSIHCIANPAKQLRIGGGNTLHVQVTGWWAVENRFQRKYCLAPDTVSEYLHTRLTSPAHRVAT